MFLKNEFGLNSQINGVEAIVHEHKLTNLTNRIIKLKKITHFIDTSLPACGCGTKCFYQNDR